MSGCMEMITISIREVKKAAKVVRTIPGLRVEVLELLGQGDPPDPEGYGKVLIHYGDPRDLFLFGRELESVERETDANIRRHIRSGLKGGGNA